MPCFRRLIWTLAALLTCFAAEGQLSAALVPSTQRPSFSAQEIERGYRQGRVLVKRRALASVAGVDQEAVKEVDKAEMNAAPACRWYF